MCSCMPSHLLQLVLNSSANIFWYKIHTFSVTLNNCKRNTYALNVVMALNNTEVQILHTMHNFCILSQKPNKETVFCTISAIIFLVCMFLALVSGYRKNTMETILQIQYRNYMQLFISTLCKSAEVNFQEAVL